VAIRTALASLKSQVRSLFFLFFLFFLFVLFFRVSFVSFVLFRSLSFLSFLSLLSLLFSLSFNSSSLQHLFNNSSTRSLFQQQTTLLQNSAMQDTTLLPVRARVVWSLMRFRHSMREQLLLFSNHLARYMREFCLPM